MGNGTVSVQKQLHRDILTNVRGTTQALNRSLLNQWIGFKFMVYNYTKQERKESKTCVGLELWIDDNVTDENGFLVVRNDWKPVMTMRDEGGWITKKTLKGCPSLDSNSEKKTRQKGDIITMAGGPPEQNCVTFSWDSKVAFQKLSVREIERVSAD